MLSSTAKGFIAIALIIALAIAGPFLVLWVLNTLFGLHLAYGAQQWLAALLLCLFFTALNAL